MMYKDQFSGEVALVSWPRNAERAAQLEQQGRPRLLILDEVTDPPIDPDPLVDWVRPSTSDRDRDLRVATLLARSQARRQDSVVIDDKGLVRFRGKWVSLPPLEQRLTSELIDRFGEVVTRDELAIAGWPGGIPDRNVLDVHVLRLRRRLAPLDLVIRTVRSQGYVLDRAAPPDHP